MSIKTVLEEGRLIRFRYSDKSPSGEQLLCLYTAMLNDPEARPHACPAEVCPPWLALLIPWMDDAGSFDGWPKVVERVAKLAPSFGRCGHLQAAVTKVAIRELLRLSTPDIPTQQYFNLLISELNGEKLSIAFPHWSTLPSRYWFVRDPILRTDWIRTVVSAIRPVPPQQIDEVIHAILDVLEKEVILP